MLHASTYFNLLPYVKALVQREQYRHQSNVNKICSIVFRVKFELVFTKQGKLKFSQKKKSFLLKKHSLVQICGKPNRVLINTVT